MPTVYLKQLYDSVKVPFDLKTQTVKEYVDPYDGYQERSLDTVIRGYLVEIKNFQRLNGGFGYWTTDQLDDYPLTISLISALSEIRSVGYTPNDTMMDSAVKYLKAKFYENKRPYCQEKIANGMSLFVLRLSKPFLTRQARTTKLTRCTSSCLRQQPGKLTISRK
jgi:hypothetical protein